MHSINHLNKKRNTGLSIPEFIFIIGSSLFYIDYQIQEKYKIIAPFICLMYLLFIYYKEPVCRIIIKRFIFAVFIIAFMYQFLTVSVTVKGEDVGIKYFYSNFSQYILAFFPLSIFYRTNQYATQRQVSVILGFLLFAAISLVQTSLVFVELNANILHSMNKEVLEKAGVELQGFDFVYAYTFLVITGLSIFFHTSNKWVKYISIALVVYFLYFLSKAQFALSFVTTLISCLYLYYITTKNKSNRVMAVILITIIGLIIPLILNFFISITSESEILNTRLAEIYNAIIGNSAEDSDMQARLILYWKCIEAFFSSPIIGNSYLSFNGHSTFLLAFAYLGIFGGYLICRLFYESSKFMKYILGEKYIYFMPLMCQIILMGLTNPIISVPSNFIALFFISPLLINNFIMVQKNETSI